MKFHTLERCARAVRIQRLLAGRSNAGTFGFNKSQIASNRSIENLLRVVKTTSDSLAAASTLWSTINGRPFESKSCWKAGGCLHPLSVKFLQTVTGCGRACMLNTSTSLDIACSSRGFAMNTNSPNGQVDHGASKKDSTGVARFFEELAKGLPVVVKATASAGRGLYAAKDIAEGEIIQDAAPLVAHPTLRNISSCCYLCLKYTSEASSYNLDGAMETALKELQPSFCSKECALYSEDQFYGVERKADWSALFNHCRAHDLRFPLLVARLACMVVSDGAEPDVLRPLCFVKTDPPPTQWVEEHSMVYEALKESGHPKETLSFLKLDWYVSVIARLHLNSFQVDIVRPLDPSNLLAAASDAAAGHGSAGSAVYLLPSMYNHSCGTSRTVLTWLDRLSSEPTVDIHWPRDAIARFEARRDIQKGEELTITYIDASLPVETRQKHLEWAYGFQCRCQRCQEEMQTA